MGLPAVARIGFPLGVELEPLLAPIDASVQVLGSESPYLRPRSRQVQPPSSWISKLQGGRVAGIRSPKEPRLKPLIGSTLRGHRSPHLERARLHQFPPISCCNGTIIFEVLGHAELPQVVSQQ